jgi:tetratricopeptide (TPR) repeat protein
MIRNSTTPSNAISAQAWSNLFCLCGPPDDGGRRESHVAPALLASFSRLLPGLNHSATCYLISDERPGKRLSADVLLEEVSPFLQKNAFLQITLRPVHSFLTDDADEWVEAYLRFLRACKPFQEEGYREQIIARLRIFPVVFFSDREALETASAFVTFLKECFFLPSILVPQRHSGGIPPLQDREEEPPWVRVYVTESDLFVPQRVLELLHAHEIFDRLLEDESAEFPNGDTPCLGSIILDPGGKVRSCIEAQGADVSAFVERLPEPGPELLRAARADRSICTACLLPTMEQVGTSYRANQHGEAGWHRLCDRMAGHLVKRGRYDEALAVWHSSARVHDPDLVPPALRLHMALCHYGKGDLEKAMEALEEARQAAPLSADIRYYLGLCEFGWKDYIEAADRFQEAIDLGLSDRLRTEAQYYRGLSHYHLEEYDEALKPLNEAEEAGMAGSPLPFYQGLCLLGKGEPHQALRYFQEALRRGPSPEDLFHVVFYIAHTYKEMGDFGEALGHCTEAEKIDPESRELWNLKGFCHFKRKEYDKAIACFEKAIEIDPRSAIDYANIGSNLREKGDTQGAVAMYRRALSIDPTIEFARDNLERLLAFQDRSDSPVKKPSQDLK